MTQEILPAFVQGSAGGGQGVIKAAQMIAHCLNLVAPQGEQRSKILCRKAEVRPSFIEFRRRNCSRVFC